MTTNEELSEKIGNIAINVKRHLKRLSDNVTYLYERSDKLSERIKALEAHKLSEPTQEQRTPQPGEVWEDENGDICAVYRVDGVEEDARVFAINISDHEDSTFFTPEYYVRYIRDATPEDFGLKGTWVRSEA